jgi:hypothetical protein
VPFIAVAEAYVLRHPVRSRTKRIATDGLDIVLRHAGGDQRPNREIITNHLKYIKWDEADGFPSRLRLRQYPDSAPVIESTKVPLSAVVDLWLAGEPLEDVAHEYDMTREQVEVICRTARRPAQPAFFKPA